MQNGGRDLARKFAEEYMLRHICEGGRFVDCFSGVWETCRPDVIASYDPALVQSGLVLADNTNSSVITAKQGDEYYEEFN
ncbi:hypothetical protein BDB00DRAFT_867125 [Zychaea mexicana]|uniref:uncharacterized protein n=1 Tax=Zychaea mexicana TaxID=64656 RepID=UPI0022FE07A6|nr:uncharacterized protein BDB00DRAFT_867125 [Zychaea mexicana]KAI9499053.1 hypothetical protein BDB00DRAFT_867125 [Zychaea mexicana]